MTVTRRALAPLVGAALAVALLGGCVTEVEPVPTPTAAFATEEEAFAAAEATYRAYSDALNAVSFQDLTSMTPLAELTTREYFALERKAVSEFRADGVVRGGRANIVWFTPDHYEVGEKVTAQACIDNRATTYVDAAGKSIVPQDRPTHYASALTFRETNGRLVLAESRAIESTACTS